jgi:hypothetical protein
MRTRSRLPQLARLGVIASALALSCAADPGDDPKVQASDGTDAAARPPLAGGGSPGAAGGVPTGALRDSGAAPPPGPADAGAIDASARDAASADASAIDAGAADSAGPATCPTCVLRVRYRAAVTAATSNEIKPHYDIVNAGSAAQPLAELTVRYWFTSDGEGPETYVCDYAAIGCASVRGSVQKTAHPHVTADTYLEVAFTASAGSIAPGGSTADIQNRVHKDDYSNYDQSNDYSFDAAHGQLADWNRVTLYRAGQLVWGIEPP